MPRPSVFPPRSLPLATLLLALPAAAGRTLQEPAPPSPPAPLAEAWADLDGDGLPDLFGRAAEAPFAACLLHNGGGARLAELALEARCARLGVRLDAPASGGAWADLDGDGALDLFLAGSGATPNRLLRQDGAGVLRDVGLEYGLAFVPTGRPRRAIVADLDGDGRLDLYLARRAAADLALRREPGGTFVSLGEAAAVAPPLDWSAVLLEDLDRDGDLDLLVLLDDPARRSLCYLNRGDGQFVERSAALGLDLAGRTCDAALGDLDGDGRPELVVAALDGDRVLALEDGAWRDAGARFGLAADAGHERVRLVDLELDGALDLLLAGGPAAACSVRANRGGGTFAAPVRLAGFPPGSTLALADVDQDGAPELSIARGDGRRELVDLAAPGRVGLRVLPRGLKGNALGNGALVRVLLPDGRALERRVAVGEGDEPAAWFGLGPHLHVREVRVEWSDGGVTRVQGAPLAPAAVVTQLPGSRLVGSHPQNLLDGPPMFDLDAALERAAAALAGKLPPVEAGELERRADELLAFALARDLAQAAGPGTVAERLAAASGGARVPEEARAFLGPHAYDVRALAAAARATGFAERPAVAAALARAEREVRLDTAARALVQRLRVPAEEVAARAAARAADWGVPARFEGALCAFPDRAAAERGRALFAARGSVGALVAELGLALAGRDAGYAARAHVAPLSCGAAEWERLAPEFPFAALYALGPGEATPVFAGPEGLRFVVPRGVRAAAPFPEREALRRAELELRRERARELVDGLLGFDGA